MLIATNTCSSRQIFVATKIFCHDKHVTFVATKMILVAAPANDSIMGTHARARTHTSTHMYTQTHTHRRTYALTHIHTHAFMHASTHARTHIYIKRMRIS